MKIKLISSLFFFLAIETVAQNNLLFNPGFEELNHEGFPSDWYRPFGGHFSSSNSKKKSGERSLEMYAPGSSAGSFLSVFQNLKYDEDGVPHYIDVKPNTKYILSYWVLDTSDKVTIKHAIEWKNSADSRISISNNFSSPGSEDAPNQWKQVKETYTSPENASRITLHMLAFRQNGDAGGGKAFLDDVSFEEEVLVQAPKNFNAQVHQREVLLSWEGDVSKEYVVTYNNKEYKVRNNRFTLKNLQVNTQGTAFVRVSSPGAGTAEISFTTKNFIQEENDKRIPFLYDLKSKISKKLAAHWYELNDEIKTVKYSAQGKELKVNEDNELEFQETGKQTLKVELILKNNQKWIREFNVEVE